MLLQSPSKYCRDTKCLSPDVESTCQNEFKELVLFYVTYLWCTLGTSWCILSGGGGAYRAQRDITVEGYCILLTCVSEHFIGVERNIGVNRNYPELNAVNVTGRVEYTFLR